VSRCGFCQSAWTNPIGPIGGSAAETCAWVGYEANKTCCKMDLMMTPRGFEFDKSIPCYPPTKSVTLPLVLSSLNAALVTRKTEREGSFAVFFFRLRLVAS
jgi:hypothetical protein